MFPNFQGIKWKGQILLNKFSGPKLTQPMLIAAQDLKLDKLTVIYPRNKDYQLEKQIEVCGLANLLQKTKSL